MNNKIYLAIVRNPFDVSKDREFRQFDYIPGAPVRNYLQSCLLPTEIQVFYSSRFRKEERVITPEETDTIIPDIGDAFVVMPLVAGGDWEENKKVIGKIVAQIVLAYVTAGVGNYVSTGVWSGGMAGMSSWTTWGTLAAVATAYAGGWLINQWTPGAPVETPETTYGWGQIRNATGEGNAIPITFGEMRTGGQLLNYYIDYKDDKQYLNLLYSGGEGPCDYEGNGETDPSGNDYVSGITNILINGNPVENYRDIKIYKRAGLNNQTVISNFNNLFVEQSLAFELKQSSDWTNAAKAITSGDSGQGFKVILEMPAGCYRTTKNGLDNAEVRVNIRYRLYSEDQSTQNTWQYLNTEYFSAKSSKPIYRTVNVEQFQNPGRYEVQCLCIYKSGEDPNCATDIFWRTLTTITYDDFERPNKILLGIRALATDQLSGGMPTVTWIQKRSKGWAWNPYTLAYEQKPLNVPAWAAYDLLCRIKRYQNIVTGQMKFVEEGISHARMDYDAFAEAAEYQSEIINDKQRCVCNYFLDQSQTLWEALKPIQEVGRFQIITRGTKYSCVTDKPVVDPVQVFTVGNTMLDSFSETFVDTAKRANAIEIRFRNKAKEYEWDTAVETTDNYNSSQAVPNPVQITLAACTDWEQAHREGAYRLRQNQLITRTVSHSADIDSIACQVGDVYLLQRDVPTWGAGGRIEEVTETTVKLDAPVSFQPGKNYCIWFRMANDTLLQKSVVNPAGEGELVETDTISVSTPFLNDRHIATYVDSVQFSVPGDQTSIYKVEREIEIGYSLNSTLVTTVLMSKYDGERTIVQVLKVPDDINFVRYDYAMPNQNDIYSFGEINLEAKRFRVLSITRDGDLRRKITGVEYIESVYEELADIPVPDYTGTAEQILASANGRVDAAGNPWLDLSWTTPRHYFGARIKLNNSRMVRVDNVQSSVSIQLDSFGDYTIVVTALDLFGVDIVSTSINCSININTIPPVNVTGLSAVEDTFILRDGTVITDVDVSFERPDAFYKAFNIYYSFDASSWTLDGQTSENFYKIKLVKNTGKLTVKVCTVSPFNIESTGETVTIDLVGKSKPPSDVTGFKVIQDEYNRARMIFSWDAIDSIINPDLKGYEVRVGKNWNAGAKIGGVVYGLQTDYMVSARGNYTFFIRALDNSGNYSSNDATQSITVEVKPNAPATGKAVQDVRDSTYVSLNWSAVNDKDLAGYDIKQGDNWDKGTWIDSTKETAYRLKLQSSGTYNFMVRTRNAAGFLSSALNIPITASIEPPDVTGFLVSQKSSDPSQIRFQWDKPTPHDIAYYEIREGTTWDAGQIVASYITGLFYDAVINNESPKTFWIKAINVGGMYSQYPTRFLSVFELNPSTPTGLTVSQDRNDRSVLLISWIGIVDLDLNEYELRQGATWETGQTIVKTKELQTTWSPSSTGDYKFILKAKNNSGCYSDEVTTHYYANLEPAKVSSFMAIQNGSSVLLSWDKHPEPDVVGYEIREGSQFDNGSLIATGITGVGWETPVDTETTRQYFIKAINRAGKYSLSAVSSSVTIVNLSPKNVIYSYDELTLQNGTHLNTEFGSSFYTFATFGGKFSDYSTTRFSDVGGLTVLKLKATNGVYPTDGTYTCARKDMGSVITANIGSQFVSSVLLSSGVAAKLQYRIGRDGTTWTEWIDFVPVRATFRYIDFRVLLITSDTSKTPEVNILTETIDVPDVDRYGTATVVKGGTDILLGHTYWQNPVVTPTAIGQELHAELASVAIDKFRVRVLNTSGTDVGGQINWISRGF